MKSFYEKLVEAAHGVGDTVCHNPDTNEVTAVGASFDGGCGDYSVLIDSKSGDVSFIDGPAEILVLPKNGPVMDMLNKIYEEFGTENSEEVKS